MTFTVVPASYVLLRRGDAVLLQLRQGTGYMDGHWTAGAAGHIELGETAVHAAVREAEEELGVRIAPDDLEAVTVMQRTDGTANPIEQRVDWFFTTTAWHGEPRIVEPAKCAALEWHPLDALPAPIPAYELVALDLVRAGATSTLTSVGFG